MRRALVLCLTLAAGPVLADAYDVPWFQARPAERAEMMRRCANDAAMNRTAVCENARSATIKGRMGRPLPSDTPFEQQMRALYGMRRT